MSLFGEILDWMLAPLVFLWPVSIIATHNVANSIASFPYDQALAENVSAVVRAVSVSGDGGVKLNFPGPPRALLRSDEQDTLYFQVVDGRGLVVFGDKDIPLGQAPEGGATSEEVQFRDDEIAGEEVRVAYRQLLAAGGAGGVTVQVAETRQKRAALASRIVAGVLLPQFAIIPLAVVLTYMGLSRGISPLNRLQRLIRRRRPTDLAPISQEGIPEEVAPVIEAFNEMMLRLEQNLQAQQRFIADAAHQMRTPITGLKMQTELALHEEDPALMREALARIAQSADRASHLINQLLSLARAEASFEKIHAVEPVDLQALMRDVLHDLVPHALTKRIDLGFEESERPPRVDGNAVLLREMFRNLLDNAIKYTPSGGRVTARTYATDVGVVEVEDTGVGIAESDRERVFERFYRVLGNEASGSGLGLPIVREIAELHRAVVSLRGGAGGVGTLATVLFPLRKDAPPGMLDEATRAYTDFR